MKTIHEIIELAASSLKRITQDSHREARLLLAHTLGLSYEDVYFSPERYVTSEEESRFDGFLHRRLNHEPYAKIVGLREFWSLPFRITGDTLDPRPDSESVIEAVISIFPDRSTPLRILDLGTGSGCLLLSLLHEYPEAWGVGVDVSEAAALVAQENAVSLTLDDRASFLVGNWGDSLKNGFDVIVSNPPYIAPSEPLPLEVSLYDPATALYGGVDGLDCYRKIVSQIPNLAKNSLCHIFFEIGYGQLDTVTEITQSFDFKGNIFKFTPLGFISDLGNRPRCLIFAYHVCKNILPYA